MFAAVLDTCVLWPSLQRDFLLSLAVEGMYRPLWSSMILKELEEHEARKHIKRGKNDNFARSTAARLIAAMGSSFDDACVEGWEPLVGSYGLPDPDDEHVVAAAVVGGAGAIVTLNVKDFPDEKIPQGIQMKSPAIFAAETAEISPELALRALESISARFQNPPRTTHELLATLATRYDMTVAVDLMKTQLT